MNPTPLDSIYIWPGLSLFPPEVGGQQLTWKLALIVTNSICLA